MKQLHHDHDEMRAFLKRFDVLLAGDYESARGALPGERMIFSQLLRRHIADEETKLRALLGDGSALAAAMLGMQELLKEYSVHVSQWSPAQIERDWPAYRVAAARLEQRLRVRLAWEERELLAPPPAPPPR